MWKQDGFLFRSRCDQFFFFSFSKHAYIRIVGGWRRIWRDRQVGGEKGRNIIEVSSCFKTLGKRFGINYIKKIGVFNSFRYIFFSAHPVNMSKCSALSKKTEKLCHTTKGHLNPITPSSPSKKGALCKHLICIRGAALISEKAVCNSISFMHYVAFHMIPHSVVDHDLILFFPLM